MADKWFQPGKHLGWHKDDATPTRRRNALKSRHGNPLKAGRALQAIANVTKDKSTARVAAVDARYFFKRNKDKQR